MIGVAMMEVVNQALQALHLPIDGEIFYLVAMDGKVDLKASRLPGEDDFSLGDQNELILRAGRQVEPVLHFLSLGSSAEISLHLQIEPQAELKLVMHQPAGGVDGKVYLGAGAFLHWLSEASSPAGAGESLKGWHFVLDRDAVLETTTLAFGSVQGVRDSLQVELRARGAIARMQGLCLGQGDDRLEQLTSVHHRAAGTQSRQYFKGLFGDRARGLFNGSVVIDAEAQESHAEQLNRNLLLSTGAEIETRPELAIHADNVKATHGATIGQLDAEEIFYLRSRGISLSVAERLLVQGFIDDFIGTISSQSLREMAGADVRRKLNHFNPLNAEVES